MKNKPFNKLNNTHKKIIIKEHYRNIHIAE